MSRRERREREEREEKERKQKEKEERKKNKKSKKKSKKNKSENIFIKIIKTILKVILVFILILCLISGCIIGYLGVKTNWNKDEMLKLFVKKAVQLYTGQSDEDIANLSPIYCLVMGVSTDIDVELTDTIMVCAYYPKTQQASILSIPRDTFVGDSEYYATSSDKINAIYAINGNDPEATLEAVEELTGLDINNYLVVDTDALVKIVDEIGGVYFDVPIDMDYDSNSQDLHIHLSKGDQLIDGDKAEQLLRFRKNNDNTGYSSEYGSDDYGRMRTQREFIVATLKQTLQLKNVTKIQNLIQIAFDNIDTNLDIDEVLKYVPGAMSFDTDDIETARLPGESAQLGTYNLWFFKKYDEQTEELINEMFWRNEKNEGTVDVETSDINIQILNGSGDSEVTIEIAEELEEKGYNIVENAITTITKKSKIISKTGKSETFTDEISSIVENAILQDGSADDYSIDYCIIIGQDYELSS